MTPVPTELGRGVVVLPGQPVPAPWGSCPRVEVGEPQLADPGATLLTLHQAWSTRTPVVIELGVDSDRLREPESYRGPVHDLAPTFEFALERLHFLVWANTYDARSGEPVWWHGRKAARLLADQGVVAGDTADLTLADGTPCFVDGGPGAPPVLADGTRVVHRWNAERGVLRSARPGSPPEGLADDQRAAVTDAGGPVRVIAPAGSGKTRVLVERLRHLVVDRGMDPATVTAVAYNTKAADELRDRCADILPTGAGTIRTLNSLGLWICNRLGPDGSWTVVDEPRVRALVQQVFDVPRHVNTDTVAPYIAGLSAIRLGLRSPGEVEEAMPDADRPGRRVHPLPAGARRRPPPRLRRPDLPGPRGAAGRPGGPGAGAVPRPGAAGRRVPGPDAGPRPAAPAAVRPRLRLLRGGRRRPGDLRLRRRRPRLPPRLRPVLPGSVGAGPGGQLPVPAGGGRGRRAPARLQPPAGGQDHPGRPTGRPGLPRGAPPSGRPAGHRRRRPGRRLAGRRGGARGHRRPLPGQRHPPPRAGGLRRGRRALRGPTRSGGARADRGADRPRLPPDRARPGPDHRRRRPGHRPATVPWHRPQGGGHDRRQPGHLDRRHPAPGRPPDRSRRPQARLLRRRPRAPGRRLPAIDGRGPPDGPGRPRAGRHHGRPGQLAPGARPLHPHRRPPGPGVGGDPPPRGGVVRAVAPGQPGPDPHRRRPGAALHRPPDQGPGVGARGGLRRLGGELPPPPEPGRGG